MAAVYVTSRRGCRWRLYAVGDLTAGGLLAACGDGPCGGFTASWKNYVAAAVSPVVPDLSDPATAGCLLAMLPPGWTIDPSNNGFRVTIHGEHPTGPVDYVGRDDDGRPWFHVIGDTLGEAVARALLAVWGAA